MEGEKRINGEVKHEQETKRWKRGKNRKWDGGKAKVENREETEKIQNKKKGGNGNKKTKEVNKTEKYENYCYLKKEKKKQK